MYSSGNGDGFAANCRQYDGQRQTVCCCPEMESSYARGDPKIAGHHRPLQLHANNCRRCSLCSELPSFRVKMNTIGRLVQRAQFRPLFPPRIARGYALSRFPKNPLGTARARDRPQPVKRNIDESNAPPTPQDTWIESPSQGGSTIWQASQRPPTSNPRQGLEHLLMDSDSLIIERSVAWAVHRSASEVNPGRLRC